jgi:hypothetical protein
MEQTLFATMTGGRKHLAQCPHVLGKNVVQIPPDDPRDVCDFCQKELDGFGRTYFDDLDAALEAYKAPIGNRPLIKQALAHIAPDEIWMPYSDSYIALGREGRGVAWAHKTFVEPALGTFVELPGFSATAKDGSSPDRSEVWGDICPTTYLRHSVGGSCEFCG